jgi:hypothetical protein
MKLLLKVFLFFAAVFTCSTSYAQIYSNSFDAVPPGYKGPIFQLSREYPVSLPTEQDFPWLQFDFKSQALEYIQSLLKYILEGNIDVDWILQDNPKRTWYHAPSMVWGSGGREFTHGLTGERHSRAFELHPLQTKPALNWAVGFYNPLGGYIVGRVWADTLNPKLSEAVFPEGTVGAKLLFTDAELSQVPYLKNSYEIKAFVPISINDNKKTLKTMRLLQMDVAVKDSRSTSTGWVFGTFVYNAKKQGKTKWDKLVPVGLSWGNDPQAIVDGSKLQETWINQEFINLFTFDTDKTLHLGYKDRLNGPVDNPLSSCISCHSQAQIPVVVPVTPKFNDIESVKKYFRNIKSGELFQGEAGSSFPLDYSLQLSRGIDLMQRNRQNDSGKNKITKDTLLSLTTADDEKITQKIDSIEGKRRSDSIATTCMVNTKCNVGFSLKDYLEVIGTILTLLTIGFGILQYKKAQKWKRLEFVSNEIDQFESDKDIINARFMLDWDERYIELYYDDKQLNSENRFVLVNDAMIKKALLSESSNPDWDKNFTSNEIRIRDTFDVLFGYFAGFYANIRTGLVSFDEYYPHIKYWLDILSNPENDSKDEEFKKIVRKFLTSYQYKGVLWLFESHLKMIKK